MLKGNMSCKIVKKYLIKFINLELNTKDEEKIALHLRNCPNCLQIFNRLEKRKKELKSKFIHIENRLRMENEISAFIDNETGKKEKLIILNMLKTNDDYKKEKEENEKLRQILKTVKEEVQSKISTNMAEETVKKFKKKSKINYLEQHLQYLLHVLVKS